MFKLFGKKEETVSRAEYDAKLSLIAALEQDVRFYQCRNGQLNDQVRAARAEAEANKVDADKYRRSRANLKQFRKEAANV